MRIGVIAAFAAEVRSLTALAPNAPSSIAVCGMGMEAATDAASAMADAGASALISWGFAGGLDVTLPSGTLFIPSRVLFEGREFDVDSAWRKLVCNALVTSEEGTLLTSAVPLMDIREKRSAFERCGARAVDMESAAVARVAHERGLPFLAIKVILDTVTDVLPGFIANAVSRERVSGSQFLLGLLRRPTCLPACWRLISQYRCALRTLDSAAVRLQPTLFASRSTAD